MKRMLPTKRIFRSMKGDKTNYDIRQDRRETLFIIKYLNRPRKMEITFNKKTLYL